MEKEGGETFGGQGRFFNQNALVWDDSLALAASDACFDEGRESSKVKYRYGSDKSSILDRIQRYGIQSGATYGESISYGVDVPLSGGIEKNAFEIVMNMLARQKAAN